MTTSSDLQRDGQPPHHRVSLRRFSGHHSDYCPGDEQLSIEVKLALLRACPTLAYSIDITTQDSVVHLRGSVGSERYLTRMYKAARSVAGIHWICNDVTIVRPAPTLRLEFKGVPGAAALA